MEKDNDGRGERHHHPGGDGCDTPTNGYATDNGEQGHDDPLADWVDRMNYPVMRTTDPFTRVETTGKMMHHVRQRWPLARWLLTGLGLLLLAGWAWIAFGASLLFGR